MMRLGYLSLPLVLFLSVAAHSESNFDLTGPSLDVRVTRNGAVLPIAQVPNLEAGDRLWLRPDLPPEQAARYLLVALFLRGSTNPPPDNWFSHAESWSRSVREQGITVTVPSDAQQALVFLAPETNGDFSTLRSNVRARPGAFVRASQDLNQASLDRSRLDTYIAGITQISLTDPNGLKDASKLLARSLNIKVDSDCFDKPAAQQLACLTKDQNALVLDDGHTQSMVASLTTGASADLIGQLSASSLGGAGAYSPYVGAIVDVVRIMNGVHTAQYQYIPALIEPREDRLLLKLNNPPSFSNPKSVLTVGLPGIAEPQLPPLRAVNPEQVYCAEKQPLVLPVQGAPIVYASSLGHDFVLHIQRKKGASLDLPAWPEAVRGGFVVDTHNVQIASMDAETTGILRGRWGFDSFEGPSFHLASAGPANWKLPDAEKDALIVGRDDTVLVDAPNAACVDSVSIKDSQGGLLKAGYKLVKPDELEVEVSLKNAIPGPMTLLLKQTGETTPGEVRMRAYSEAAHLNSFIFYQGDSSGTLEGARLDEVLKLELKGAAFTPAGLKRSGKEDELAMTSAMAAQTLKAGDKSLARVMLDDGREMNLQVTIQPPRPKATLLSKNIDTGLAAASPIRLANQNELPQDSTLSFVLQTAGDWPRTQKIEVATVDASFHVMLSVEDGSLTLQDSKTVLATLNPLKSFGPSAFGPLRFRAVDEDSVAGDWQPLGNLVRIPTLKQVRCPINADKPCTLEGSNLFLLDSVSSSADFKTSTLVPVGFANSTIDVPRPNGTLLYIKLRDDPTAVNVAALPVLPE